MVRYENLIINGKYNEKIFHKAWNMDVFKHTVIVKNADNNKYIKFYYYAGAGKKQNSNEYVNKPEKADYLNAFYCFLTDASAYIESNSYFDFCNNFGYTPNKESHKIYIACKSAYDRITKLLNINENQFCDFINDFQEKNPDSI